MHISREIVHHGEIVVPRDLSIGNARRALQESDISEHDDQVDRLTDHTLGHGPLAAVTTADRGPVEVA